MSSKGSNKGEGPLGLWKSRLAGELINYEANLREIYSMAGLQTNFVIAETAETHYEKDKEDFEAIFHVDKAARNICSMIKEATQYYLPIPVNVILKLAGKAGALRCADYTRKSKGPLETYVFSLAPYLTQIESLLLKTLIEVLGTNIISSTPFINKAILRTLEWTRTSHLQQHDPSQYHFIRGEQFKTLSLLMSRLSLNINLEPQALKTLLEVELVANLDDLMWSSLPMATTLSRELMALRDAHLLETLDCLKKISFTYRNLLDAPIELSLKTFVTQNCLKIYRDFDATITRIGCHTRKQLLQLLEIIADQPYASSTTAIAYRIFELAMKLEGDPDMQYFARQSLQKGLAHRPIIVSHHDVFDLYGKSLVSSEEDDINDIEMEKSTQEETPTIELATTLQTPALEPAKEVPAKSPPVGKSAVRESKQDKTIELAATEEEPSKVEFSKAPPVELEEGLKDIERKADSPMFDAIGDEQDKSIDENESEKFLSSLGFQDILAPDVVCNTAKSSTDDE